MINALSIDLEYWWCNEFLTDYLPEGRVDLIIESLYPLLHLLEKYNVKATFFVLGSVAEKYPQVIEDLYQKGHEIASHAYSHRTLEKLGKEEFIKEIKTSLDLLGSYHPVGFRAPSFSAKNTTRWYLDVLEKYGFLYDSSIFPVNMILYGVPDAPLWKYKPSKDNIAINDPDGSIIEFPLSVVKIGKKIPVAGGFYFRFFPERFLFWSLNRINKTHPAVIYIHPWETYPGIPRLKLPFHYQFEAYYGVNHCLKKFENLVKTFEFQPIREFLHEI
jgi:polysaccharide deacetylase family protein (PEP-CTERM system associated)